MAETTDTITIQWRSVPSSDRAHLYKVNIKGDEREFTQTFFVSFGKTVNEMKIDKLLPNRKYDIKIKAVNIVGDGTFSEKVTATTKKIPGIYSKKQFGELSSFFEQETEKALLFMLFLLFTVMLRLNARAFNRGGRLINYCAVFLF